MTLIFTVSDPYPVKILFSHFVRLFMVTARGVPKMRWLEGNGSKAMKIKQRHKKAFFRGTRCEAGHNHCTRENCHSDRFQCRSHQIEC